MKTKEELNTLKKEAETIHKKLVELSEEELAEVTGGIDNTKVIAALKVIDNALQRALNQEAFLGAVVNKLEVTGDNLATSGEILQSGQSIYRDADMAK